MTFGNKKHHNKSMKKQKFDLIFSLGGACPTSMLLRKNRLQKFSYPLDWLGGTAHMSDRVNFVCHSFRDFLNEEDLRDENQLYMDRDGPKRLIHNVKNDLLFNHDFSGEKSLHEDYPRVFEKYQRRIHRLMQAIQKSHRILVVFQEYAQNPVPLKGPQELLACHQQLNRAFPHKEWFILYFENCPQMSPQVLKEEQVSPFIWKVSANYKSVKAGDAPWSVNEKLLNRIYKKLRLKKPFRMLFQENLILSLAFLIPFRGMKRKFLGHFFKNYFEV